jgi:hypothetical protein
MPSHPPRPALRAGISTLLLTLALALPGSAGRAQAADPDNPYQLEGTAPPSSQSFLRRDLDHLATSESIRLLVAGGALAFAVHAEEDPDRAEQLLDRGGLDGGLDLGTTYGHGAVLGAGAATLFAAGALANDPNLRNAGSEALRSLAWTGLAVTSLKLAVHRTRPNGGKWSFPSGHTAAAFSVAPVLARHFGSKVAIPAYALATATALGRMEDRKHFLSDVLAGAAIGLAVGRAVSTPETNGGVAPSLLVGPSGAGVSITF